MKKLIATLAFFVAYLPAPCAHALSDVEVSANGAATVRLLPGQHGEFTIAIKNRGPDAIAAVTFYTSLASFVLARYPLDLPAQIGCGTLDQGGVFGLPGYHFTVGPLEMGQSIQCRFLVQREASSIDDLELIWRTHLANGQPLTADRGINIAIGSLADIGLRSQTLTFAIDPDGHARSLVRLTVDNLGPSLVGDLLVGACTDNFFPAFSLDGSMSGGCDSFGYQPICFDGGFAAQIAALDAGESSSCLIELRSSEVYTSSLAFDVGTIELRNPITHGSILDVAGDNNHVVLVLGGVTAPALPSAGIWALMALIVILGAIALRRLRAKDGR